MKYTLTALLALVAMGSTACSMNRAIVTSTEKKVYVVRAQALGSNVLACSAESGKPVCTEVAEGE